MRTNIKNWPKQIYLQPGQIDDGDDEIDFDSLSHEHITWCSDRVESNDAKYIHESAMQQARHEYAKELLVWISKQGFDHSYDGKSHCKIKDGVIYNYGTNELIEMFDKHLEEERGRE